MSLLYNKLTLLPFFWNYSLFKKGFENIVNDPQYSLLYLSMIKKKKNSLIFLQNILFLSLRKKRLKAIFNTTLIIFKKLEKKPFLLTVKVLLLSQIFIQSINLCLKKIFSFIPFKFRSNLMPAKKDLLLKLTSLQSFYTISFEIISQTSKFLKKMLKFIKKIFVYKDFLVYFFQFFKLILKIKTRKKFFRFFFQVEYFLNNLYYTQIDCWFFYISSQFSLNFSIKYGSLHTKLNSLIKAALNNCKSICLLNCRQKISKLKKKTKASISTKYIRINKNVLIFFTGSILQFYCYKKQISFFLKNVFGINIKVYINNFSLLGFKFYIFCSFYKYFPTNVKNKNLLKCNFKKLAPLTLLKKTFMFLGFLNYQKKPKNFKKILNFLTFDILNWYSFLLIGLHTYYLIALNIKTLKLSIYYILKWSLLYTLVKKHKKTVSFILIKYLKYTKFFLTLLFKETKLIKFRKTMFFENRYFFKYFF
jgi:hypothetical protein